MSRGEGFDIMDMSTAICEDPKFKRLARLYPDELPVAFMAYVATVAASWREGQRVPIDDAWPGILPYRESAIEALRRTHLIDRRNRVSIGTWTRYFGAASERREHIRAKWRRSNERRRTAEVTARSPRSDSGDRSVPLGMNNTFTKSSSARARAGGMERLAEVMKGIQGG